MIELVAITSSKPFLRSIAGAEPTVPCNSTILIGPALPLLLPAAVPAGPSSDACLMRFSAAPQLFTHFGPYVMPHQARPHLIICSPPAALLCSSSIPNSLPLRFISFHRFTAIS